MTYKLIPIYELLGLQLSDSQDEVSTTWWIPRIVSKRIHPGYKWINPTYPTYNWGYNLLTKLHKWDFCRIIPLITGDISHLLSGMIHQAEGMPPKTRAIDPTLAHGLPSLGYGFNLGDPKDWKTWSPGDLKAFPMEEDIIFGTCQWLTIIINHHSTINSQSIIDY